MTYFHDIVTMTSLDEIKLYFQEEHNHHIFFHSIPNYTHVVHSYSSSIQLLIANETKMRVR